MILNYLTFFEMPKDSVNERHVIVTVVDLVILQAHRPGEGCVQVVVPDDAPELGL